MGLRSRNDPLFHHGRHYTRSAFAQLVCRSSDDTYSRRTRTVGFPGWWTKPNCQQRPAARQRQDRICTIRLKTFVQTNKAPCYISLFCVPLHTRKSRFSRGKEEEESIRGWAWISSGAQVAHVASIRSFVYYFLRAPWLPSLTS